MENFIIITTYLLIGVLLRRVPQFPNETGQVLNLFVIYVALPATVLLKIPELSFSQDLLVPVLMPWVMLILSCVMVLLLTRIFRWERQITGSLLLLVPLGNTSFLGIPMVKAFFGEKAISYALLYDQFGSFLALAIYGSVIIALYGGGKDRPTIKGVCNKIITFPPFIALLLAFALRSTNYHPVALEIFRSLSATLVPAVMIAVGFQLSFRLSRDVVMPFAMGLLLKLAVAPFTALILCKLLSLEGQAVQVSIFEAGMPPMVSAGALALLAGLAPSLTVALVGFGIGLSFITLPVLYSFL